MKNNKMISYIIMIVSVILFIGTIFLLNDTKIIAPVIIVISIYLFVGSIIKLCKTNKKLKNSILCAFDLLFWIP